MSVTSYDLLLPRRIVFGWGRRSELPDLIAELGQRAWLVVGSKTLKKKGIIDALATLIRAHRISVERLTVISREPEVRDVNSTTKKLIKTGVGEGDVIVAIGGGAAIDLGKAVAAMATNREGDGVQDYLEGVGRGLKIESPPLPMVAVPTTAGTGSEATKNAVISSYRPLFKKSLRSNLMIPDAVLVDPELTVSAPHTVTAHSGMDALTQCIESYISRRAKPVPQTLALQGIQLAVRYLAEAVKQPDSRPAREAMAHSALLSGIALANSGLGMAHGVAAALGVHCKVPHGLACAVMLPAALECNHEVAAETIRDIERGIEVPGDYRLNENSRNALSSIVDSIADRIGIPKTLSELGVRNEQIPAIVNSSRGNSMSGNPRELSDEELTEILERML